MRKRLLLWLACIFLTGVACAYYKKGALLLIPFVLFLQEWRIGLQKHTCKNAAGRSVLLLSAFFLGMLHMQGEIRFRETYLSRIEDGNTVTIWGEIKKIEATEYGNRCIFTDCYIRIQEDTKGENVQSKYIKEANRLPCNDVMVYTSATQYQVGEIREITGEFNNFTVARNQGNFNGRIFYQSQKIDFAIKEETSRLLGNNQNLIQNALLSLSKELKQVFHNGMSKRSAGFFIGMILGDKSNLEDTTKNLFIMGGISHILAISGVQCSIFGVFYSA